MQDSNKYSFSFTALSLGLKEMCEVAKSRVENVALEEEAFGHGNSQTGKRKLLEVNRRLDRLTPYQIQLLADASLSVQKQLALLAVCKSYQFIRLHK